MMPPSLRPALPTLSSPPRRISPLGALLLAALLVGAFALPGPTLGAQGEGDGEGDRIDLRLEVDVLVENPEELSDAERLHALFDLIRRWGVQEFPESGVFSGEPEADNRAWTDNSREAFERREALTGVTLPLLDAIDRASLSPEDQLNYDLFRRGAEQGVEGARYPGHLMPINQMGGFQQWSPQLIGFMPTRTVSQVEDILARLEGIPQVLEHTRGYMEEGMEKGITPPRVTLRAVADQIAAQAGEDPEASPFWRPFAELPDSIPEAEAERLRQRARTVISEQVFPAFRQLHRFWVEEYLPATRESLAMADLPDGAEWYAFNVESSTTTDLTPQEIHDIGLAEVARIRGEMEKVVEESGFEGTFLEFLEFLRTDPQFFYDTPEELLAAYRDIAKRADAELPALFGTLPRLPYGVTAVPSYSEQSQTTAYYQRGSPELGRAGFFYANTYDLPSRPSWEMEALTLHEAVPGHHLQIALAQELEDVPKFRQQMGVTAFVEGWGLYAESLGEEMGFYQDPYSKFGQLTYEMWRAIRLVVDTGIHALGWSRDQAIEYFKANTGKSEHDITVEVDRYIVWPGQALAYKIGELKIKELRARAEKELGESFDIRAFHDRLLGAGAIPLDTLEARMDEWIAEQKAGRNEG